MALTKATLTGTVDTIKAGFTKVNDIIDDLAAVTTGLGASCIGVYDVADNMAATDVEAALAEIYADHSSTKALAEIFDEDTATTTGLTWGWKAGAIRVDNTITVVSADTISLTDDDVNYIEISQAGVVSRNTTGFTSGYIPIRQVTAAGGVQTVSTDKRAWFVQVAQASTTVVGTAELATDAETLTGTDTGRVTTPSNITAKLATPGAIGGGTPAAGAFTTISASGLITATGGQIAFPATAVPSADPNTLDDYEEGTCTMLFAAGTSGTITIDANVDVLSYTKIGRAVTICGQVAVGSVSSPVGTLTITGLPFACHDGLLISGRTAVTLSCSTLEATAITAMQGHIDELATVITITIFAAGDVGSGAAHCKAGSVFIINVTYFI